MFKPDQSRNETFVFTHFGMTRGLDLRVEAAAKQSGLEKTQWIIQALEYAADNMEATATTG